MNEITTEKTELLMELLLLLLLLIKAQKLERKKETDMKLTREKFW